MLTYITLKPAVKKSGFEKFTSVYAYISNYSNLKRMIFLFIFKSYPII